jgi:hypothetical protein
LKKASSFNIQAPEKPQPPNPKLQNDSELQATLEVVHLEIGYWSFPEA